MMIVVKLIDDNWNKENQPEWLKNVLLVGDELPRLNQPYTVENQFYDNGELVAYRLEGFEHLLNYDENAGWFKIQRFELISSEFKPNSVVSIGENTFIAEKFYITATFDLGEADLDIGLETVFVKE